MAEKSNLVTDLFNNLNTERYFLEMEFGRLSQDPNINYKEKIDKMTSILKDIVIIKNAIPQLNTYYPGQVPNSQAPQQNNTNQQQNVKTHPGQSHGE